MRKAIAFSIIGIVVVLIVANWSTLDEQLEETLYGWREPPPPPALPPLPLPTINAQPERANVKAAPKKQVTQPVATVIVVEPIASESKLDVVAPAELVEAKRADLGDVQPSPPVTKEAAAPAEDNRATQRVLASNAPALIEPPAPAKTVPAKTIPAKTIPAKTVPAKTIPTKTVPTKTIPAKTVPTKTIPAKTIPAKTIPTKTIPAKTVPAKTIPTKTVPTKTVPAKTVPAKTIPTKTVPAKTIPTRTVPAKTVPTKTVPAKTVPTKTAPEPVSSGVKALSDASKAVLERTEPEVLAQALAQLPAKAIEALPTATLERLTAAVQTLPIAGLAQPKGTAKSAEMVKDAATGDSDVLLRPLDAAAVVKALVAAPADQLAALPREVLADALSAVPAQSMQPLSTALVEQSPAAIEAAEADVRLDGEAQSYVQELTKFDSRPILASSADHFVSGEQKVALATAEDTRLATLDELLATPGVDLTTPITIIRISDKLERLDPQMFATASAIELARPIDIVEADRTIQVPVYEALKRHKLARGQPVTLVRKVRHLEPTTLLELKSSGRIASGQQIEILKRTVAGREAVIEELLNKYRRAKPHSLFYIRTVRDSDIQGIWGIIQAGLVDNFARGMAVKHGQSVDRYRVRIPRDADEPLADASSSFLGRLIHVKTAQSTVFNIKEGRIADNPNLIRPGQQIVIVDFSADELVNIYRHFAQIGQRAAKISGQ